MPALDLKGCLEDSPTFRKRVNSHEEGVQNFETSLKSILKLARSQVNLSSGNATSPSLFLNCHESKDKKKGLL